MGQSAKSNLLAGFEQRFAADGEARRQQVMARSWMGEALEWSFYFTPELWEPVQGKCLPTASYHAAFLKNMLRCCMREGYSEHEVAFWMEVVARDHIKTTMIRLIMLFIMTEVVKSGRYTPKGHLEEDMIYITGTEPKARKKMTWLWHQLRSNRKLRNHYGSLLPRRADPETATGIEAQLANGFWVAAFGMKGGIRSAHPRFLFVDDPEELAEGDEKKVTENTWDIWSRTVDGMMGPGTSTCYTANYVGQRCLTKKLTKIHPRHFIERPCYSEIQQGDSRKKIPLWSDRFSREFLENKRRDIGEAAFQCEWMLNPVADNDSPIKEEWIQLFDSSDRKQFPKLWWARCPIVIFFDPAYTDKDESDYTAIVTVAMDTRNPFTVPLLYCLDARRGRWTDHEEILEQVRDVYWGFRQAINHNLKVYVENAVRAEASAFLATNRLMNEKDTRSMPLRDWDVRQDGRTKRSRMSRTAHFYREHRMFFDVNDPHQQDVIDELVLFGEEEHDDYADACTGCLNVFRVNEKHLLRRMTGRVRRRTPQFFRDPQTGVLRERQHVSQPVATQMPTGSR